MNLFFHLNILNGYYQLPIKLADTLKISSLSSKDSQVRFNRVVLIRVPTKYDPLRYLQSTPSVKFRSIVHVTDIPFRALIRFLGTDLVQ